MKIRNLVTIIILLVFFVPETAKANTKDFNDVPKSHWSYSYVTELRERNVTDGIGNNNFGIGKPIKRAEFVKFLCDLMKWQPENSKQSNFADNSDNSKWYFKYVETGFKKNILVASQNFRPEEFITREEMAVMIVKTLGYDELAKQVSKLETGFQDIQNKDSLGYINIAKDLGVISGVDNLHFAPDKTATREEAATMIIQMARRLDNKLENVNGFYAIKSVNQMDIINDLDFVSFGWSRLEIQNNVTILNTTSSNNNEYSIPDGFSKPFNEAINKEKMLMIAVSDNESSEIINNESLRNSAITQISNAINNGIEKDNEKIIFDGVVLDFETLIGETSKNNYNSFVTQLKKLLDNNKKIIIAVHPQRKSGEAFYNGYDYKTLGDLADKIILMAHDYNAKVLTNEDMENKITTTPLAPIDEIYFALRAVTDKKTGVSDKNKIMLQISFGSAQWKMKDGKIINEKPFQPAYDDIAKRINQNAELQYSKALESPYLKFINNEDNTENIIWYENNRSVSEKIKLSLLFGVKDISLWRLGNIPNQGASIDMDVMPIISYYKK